MAGESCGARGPIAMRNPGMLLDVALAPGASFSQQVRRAVCWGYGSPGAGTRPALQSSAVKRAVRTTACLKPSNPQQGRPCCSRASASAGVLSYPRQELHKEGG